MTVLLQWKKNVHQEIKLFGKFVIYNFIYSIKKHNKEMIQLKYIIVNYYKESIQYFN